MAFPIDKRIVQVVCYPAPDVVPEMLDAIDDVPVALWDEHDDLYELADAIEPYLEKRKARKWDFIWSMERHFSEPYGPLPKARQSFMAGIPDMFLQNMGTPAGGGTESAERAREAGALIDQADMNRLVQDDVEVEAFPYEYEAGSEMSEEYIFWLEKLMFAHGECMMPYFGEKAKGLVPMYAAIDKFSLEVAPNAGTRLRLHNFSNEELKHTYQFYAIYREFDPELPVRIFEHEREVFRAYEAMKMEPEWFDRCINNCLSDRFGVYQGFEWVQSSYAPLARVSLKVVKDERGHSNMAYIHLREYLEEGGDAARTQVQERINAYWYPYFMAAFGSDESKNNRQWRRYGLKQHKNPQLRLAYHDEVTEMLASLGIEAPDLDDSLARGLELVAQARSATTQ